MDLNADADRRVGAALRLIGSPVYRAVVEALEAHAIDKVRAVCPDALLAELASPRPLPLALDDRLREALDAVTAGFVEELPPGGGNTTDWDPEWEDDQYNDER